MASFTVDHSIEHGEYVQEIGTITMDSSYATGGEALDATGDSGWFYVSPMVSSGGYVGRWDASAQKVQAFYGDNNNAADGPLIEVPAATDLSAVTFVLNALRVK